MVLLEKKIDFKSGDCASLSNVPQKPFSSDVLQARISLNFELFNMHNHLLDC